MFRWISSAWLFVGLAVSARAQFPGDVYFQSPSQVVPFGQTATIAVDLFAGAEVFGALSLDIEFDPAQVEVQSVSAGTTSEVSDGMRSRLTAGKLRIAVVNGKSLTSPIGTVNLASVVVRVIAAPGSQFRIRLSNVTWLNASVETRTTRTFDATVTVTDASLLVGAVHPDSNQERVSSLEALAATMAPEGVEVLLYEVFPAPFGGFFVVPTSVRSPARLGTQRER